MMNWNSLKKSLLNGGMLAAVLCALIILFRPLFNSHIFQNGKDVDILSATIIPLAMSSFAPFACIFPILPYALSYVEEKSSGYYRNIMIRCGKKKYIKNKVFAVGLSGGAAMVIPFLILFIVLGAVTQSVSAQYFPEAYIGKIWEPYMYIWGGWLVLFVRIILFFLFGFLWAEIALMISLFVENRYIAFIVPYILYQLGWYVLPRNINPAMLLRADFDMEKYITIYFPVLMQTAFCVMVIVLNYSVMRKKIQDV